MKTASCIFAFVVTGLISLPAYAATCSMSDPKPVVNAYASLVENAYKASLGQAKDMQKAINAFLAAPGEDTLKAARDAWVKARPAYLETEAFRFYDGPIDFENKATGESGPEGRINAWPLNEAYIDYVKGNPKAGIVNDKKEPITLQSLKDKNQKGDEEDVTTGWHAIEFLLWGQDFNDNGPGTRPASDYAKGDVIKERRREYLRLVTQLLVEDLETVTNAWGADKASYANTFKAMDAKEAIGKLLTGIASLAGSEMSGERINNALMSGERKDAQSCFSGTTNQDFVYDAKGLGNVYASASCLVAEKDKALDEKITKKIAAVEAQMKTLPDFEAILKTAKGSKERKLAEAAVADLRELADLLKAAGGKLGVPVEIVPAS